ncbi:MAG: Crp/Fnr family transcriptional regulator [Bacteroidota bacterium]
MHEFFTFLNSLYPLPDEAQAAMMKVTTPRKMRKGQHLLKKGDVCTHLTFIKRGLLKVYFLRKGKEVALWFNIEMDCVLSVESFFSQKPSEFWIKCETNCELLVVPYPEVESLYDRYPVYNRHARLILQHYYSLSEAHVKLAMMEPRQRYEEIKKRYPWMVDGTRLTKTMLADYIGVDRATLSRWLNGK